MPTAIQSLDNLNAEQPDLFDPKPLNPDWLEGWAVIPVDRPDKPTEPIRDEDGSSSLTPWLDGPEAEEEEPFDREWNNESLYPVFDGLGLDPDAPPGFPGGPVSPTVISPGSSVAVGSAGSASDCYAFYLPIHFYHPDWWGIYLLADGVEKFAEEIWHAQTTGQRRPLSFRDCRMASRIFLYWHEHYHHQVESFSIRLEVTQRQPLYRNGFTPLYRQTFGTSQCLEEALAEAWAYLKTIRIFDLPRTLGKRIPQSIQDRVAQKRCALERALKKLIKDAPQGYCQGRRYLSATAHKDWQNQLAERYHGASLPHIKNLHPSIWGNSPHAFYGFSNVRSRVNYLIPRNSRIAQRLPLHVWPRLSHRDLVKRLKKLIPNLEKVPARGKHPLKYRTPGQRAFPIPTHPGDLSNKTLGKILKQAGLEMGISKFLAIS